MAFLDNAGLQYFKEKLEEILAPKASPALTGTPTAPTAPANTNNTQIATTAFVNSAFQSNKAFVYKGTIGSSGATITSLPAIHYQGWAYRVLTAGTYAGQSCENGDALVCIEDGTSADNSHWMVLQKNIDGAVTGPASSSADHVAIFDGTTGKKIKDSGYTIATSVPSGALFTDTNTKVTSSANHYLPTTDSGGNISASASGATAAWSIDVVKGVTLQTDGKGHVTGLSVTSGKIPANPDTNTTYGNMTAATASAAGKAGLVPAPAAGKQTSFLRGDGTWVIPTNTTYAFANSAPTLAWNTTSTIGTVGGTALTVKMPANPNTNTTYAFTNSGPTLAWNTTSTVGVVGGVALTVKMPANPNTNTTYGNASTSAAGLVSTGAQSFAGAKTFTSAITINKADAPAVGAVSNALSISYKSTGGTVMTAVPIAYIGTNSSDGYNTGVILGSNNGTTIVGAGESSRTFSSANSIYNDENLYLTADGSVFVYPGVSNDGAIQGKYSFPAIGAGKTADMSQAITGISRSGTTFTATRANGTTFTFTQQDNNTTYSFSNSAPTLAWNTTSTVGVVGGVALTVKLPANPNTNTTYAAGSGLALSGTTFRVDVPRVAESANHLPANNSFQLREYTNGTNYGLPSNAWYHIYEAKGSDGNYGTQLALGMTTDAVYYRKYASAAWGSWHSLINTNTTYSFSNSAPTLSWGATSTVGTVGGVALTVKMPANPNTNTTYGNATTSAAGLVSTGAQSFAGNKTFTGVVTISNATASTALTNGALVVSGGIGCSANSYFKQIYFPAYGGTYGTSGQCALWYNGAGVTQSGESSSRLRCGGDFQAAKVYGAVWNDYAEYRKAEIIEGGRCVYETEEGTMKVTHSRLQAGCRLTSDTFGTCMGETAEAKTPIAVAGRVLAYPYTDRKNFHLGDAVCSAPDGTVDIMTREEICKWPERIIGTVSEIPDYETWNAGSNEESVSVPVKGRIWIYVR